MIRAVAVLGLLFTATAPAQRGLALNTPALSDASRLPGNGIDWRFVDPGADVVAGFDVRSLSNSPLSRYVITWLGALRNLNETDIKRLLDGLADVDHVAISVHGSQIVAFVVGHTANPSLPVGSSGLKSLALSPHAMLAGHAEAVDRARLRLVGNSGVPPLAQAAAQMETGYHVWAVGSPRSIWSDAPPRLRRFTLAGRFDDRLISDLALDFTGDPPDGTEMPRLRTPVGFTSVEDSRIHVRTSLDGAGLAQDFDDVVAGPLGAKLALLIEAARYLPLRQN